MASVSLLDCTLRDGGYVNQWKFSNAQFRAIVHALHSAGIEYIECGYLNPEASQDTESTQFKTLADFNALFHRYKDLAQLDASFFLMTDFGKFDFSTLAPADQEDNYLAGVRLAFRRSDFKAAVESLDVAIEKGYKVCVQPMVTSTYPESELLELLEMCRERKIFAFYLVDSFGTMSKEEMRRLYYLCQSHLGPEVRFGFHSHNNLQLAFSNAMEFIDLNRNRNTIVDTSVFGMGRGAGNLNTEIFTDYLNKHYNRDYDLYPLLQVIDDHLEAIYHANYWGFSPAYFLSASAGCHPNYGAFFSGMKTLPVSSIKKLLDSIAPEKLHVFDKDYAQELYLEFQNNNTTASEFDSAVFDNRSVLLLASGSSVQKHHQEIQSYIDKYKPAVVALNHIPKNLEADFYFFSNQRRFNQYSNEITEDSKLLGTSNLMTNGRVTSTSCIDFTELLSSSPEIDNVAIHMLKTLIASGQQHVTVAGLDGYSEQGNNYSSAASEVVFSNAQAEEINDKVFKSIQELSSEIKIEFLTPSIYEKAVKLRTLGVIPARYASSRFAGKPLADIAGKPMLLRTYEQANQAESLTDIIVATDDDRIEEFCEVNGISVLMTSSKCATGTDRLVEVANKMQKLFGGYDLYINVQGDEPVIDPAAIEQIVEAYKQYGDEYAAYNLYKRVSTDEELDSPNMIKVILNEKDELVYMSRLPVPFNKGTGAEPDYCKQVCVYGFTKASLEVFGSCEKTINERFEDIELLRFIDMGLKVKMIETEYSSISVDHPEDIKRVESYLLSMEAQNSGKPVYSS